MKNPRSWSEVGKSNVILKSKPVFFFPRPEIQISDVNSNPLVISFKDSSLKLFPVLCNLKVSVVGLMNTLARVWARKASISNQAFAIHPLTKV